MPRCHGCEHFDNMTLAPFQEQMAKKEKIIQCFQRFWDINSWLDNIRAYSSGLLRAIIACNHLPFFKIFSNFVHFCPNFQIFSPFFALFFLKNRTHALTFLEKALDIQTDFEKRCFRKKKVLHYH